MRRPSLDGGEGNRPADPPEVDLWGEVVARAVQDMGLWFAVNKYDTKWSRMAARWLFSPIHRRDYFMACEFAGLCPEQTRALARRVWFDKINKDEVSQAIGKEIWEKEVVKC